jgi:hypothetical protein
MKNNRKNNQNAECQICEISNQMHKTVFKGKEIKNGLCFVCSGDADVKPQIEFLPEIEEAMRVPYFEQIARAESPNAEYMVF